MFDFDYYANVLALGWVCFNYPEDGADAFFATRDLSMLDRADSANLPARESEKEGEITAFVSGHGWTSIQLEQLSGYDHHLLLVDRDAIVEIEDADVDN